MSFELLFNICSKPYQFQTSSLDSVLYSAISTQMRSLKLVALPCPLSQVFPGKFSKQSFSLISTIKSHWIFLGAGNCLLTSESPKAASTSSRLVWHFSSNTGALYPFLNHRSFNSSATVIRWSATTKNQVRKNPASNVVIDPPKLQSAKTIA
jgi:hypothetical protein